MKRLSLMVIFLILVNLVNGQTLILGTETGWNASSSSVLGVFSRNTTGDQWIRITSGSIFARLTRFTTTTTSLQLTNSASTIGYTSVVVRFKEWLVGSTYPKNQISLMYSIDGGTTWLNSGFTSNATTTIPTSQNVSVALSSASNISALKVRFSCTGANYTGSNSYNIDDFAIYGTSVPTTYYNKIGADLSLLSSWGINTDGSGASPSDFNAAAQTFNIFNGSTATINNNDWVIQGLGSRIVVGDGTNPIVFTNPADLIISVAQLNISNNATFINASSASLPVLGTIGTNSIFEYSYDDVDIHIVPATYGILKLSGSGNKLFNGGSNYIVSNTLDATNLTGMVVLDNDLLTLNGVIAGVPVISGTDVSRLTISKTGGGTVGGLSFDPAGFISTFNITNGEVSLASDIYLESGSGTPSITISTGGTLDAGSYTIHGSAANGATANLSGTLKTSNLNGLSGGSNTTFDDNVSAPTLTNSTIEYNAGAGNQSITAYASPNSYRNVTLSGNGSKIFASATYRISGNFVKSGGSVTLDPNTTFLFNGASQNIPALNYSTVTFSGSGSKTLATDDSTRISTAMIVTGSASVATGGKLVLKAASADQTAYILDNTSGNGVSGNVTVERIVPTGRPGTPSVNGLPIFISSPVSGSLSMIQATNRNFFSYNPTITTTNKFINVNISNTVTPGLGYLVRRFGGFVFRYYGTVHTGDITQNLLFGVDNFNLIGNPYPSAITWDATNLTLTNLASSNQYRIYNGSAYEIRNIGTTIPMGQGMFVEAASAGASVTFRNQSRLAASSTLTRTVNPNENRIEIWINRSITQKDMSVIWGQENADSKTYINRYDGRKIMPTNAAFPAIFFTKESLNLDLFTYGLQENVVSVPLLVRIPKDSIYSIRFDGLNNLNPSTGILLIDSLLNTSQNLRVSDTYTFQATTSTGRRFRVLINQVVTSEDNSSNIKNSDVWLVSNQKIVSIFAPENVDAIRIYDMAGNVVYDQPANALQTDVNLQYQPEGVYIVSISFKGRLIHKKFVLSN